MPKLRKRKLLESVVDTNRSPEDGLNDAEKELNSVAAATKVKRKRANVSNDASKMNDLKYNMPQLRIKKLDIKALTTNKGGTKRSPNNSLNGAEKQLNSVADATKVIRKRANVSNDTSKKNDLKYSMPQLRIKKLDIKALTTNEGGTKRSPKDSLNGAEKELNTLKSSTKVKGKKADVGDPCKKNNSMKRKQMLTKQNSKLKKPKLTSREVKNKNKESLEQTISSDSGILSETSECTKEMFSNFMKKAMIVPHVKKEQEPTKGGDSSSESEWEEVEERCDVSLDDYKPEIPAEGVEITMDCPDLTFRKKRKKKDENEKIRLRINRIRKQVQLFMHKTHLLCLLAHGMYVNQILNSDNLKFLALSLLPMDFLSGAFKKKLDKLDEPIITKILTWFHSVFSYKAKKSVFSNVYVSLVASFLSQKSMNHSEYNLMFIVIARTLGLKVRCCLSLYPVAYKASNLIQKLNTKRCASKAPTSYEDNKDDPPPSSENGKKTAAEANYEPKMMKLENPEKLGKCNLRHKHSVHKKYKMGSDENDSNDEDYVIEENSSLKGEITSKQNYNLRGRCSKSKNYKISSDQNDTDDEDYVVDKEHSTENDTDKDLLVEEEHSNKNFTDDEDFLLKKELNNKNEKSPKQSRKSSGLKRKSNRHILSSDSYLNSPLNSSEQHLGLNSIVCWAEILCAAKKQWIPVECVNNIINRSHAIEAIAPQPVSYIIALDNASCIKDVTRRYCNEYMTSTLKLRVDPKWWEETSKPFLPPNSKLNEEEDRKLDEMLVYKPLPTTLQGFKNHPLYVLKRHLLKFEAIYPPDAPPVGFFRSEPVYARDCVHLLHSRERWMSDARVVRIGEEPYKIVKQPRWDKIARVIITGVPLEIFGEWQTEPYEPPTAVGGKVPRNEYGNVELFKPSMLPKGTVYLQLPGLSRIAKKLNIDCSLALVGFEQNRGFIRPKFDGFVVCEEFKNEITAAWNDEQENIRRREEEKREKHIYGNWKKLIKILLIRERIKLKYGTK